MGHSGFSLRLLFVVVTLISFLMWAVSSPSVASCFIGVVIWSSAGAMFGRRRYDRPLGYGAAAGAAAVIAFIVCFWPIFLCGYFFHQGPEDYFEDGFAVEAFLYPVVYCLFYAPVAAAIGVVVGTVVWLAGDRLTMRCS
jgi:hypothetical protein